MMCEDQNIRGRNENKFPFSLFSQIQWEGKEGYYIRADMGLQGTSVVCMFACVQGAFDANLYFSRFLAEKLFVIHLW